MTPHLDPKAHRAAVDAYVTEAEMRLALQRFEETLDATIGRFLLPKESGNPKVYYAVEDEHRDEKVEGETRIPAGEYQIRLRREGGMVERYDKRFAPYHDGMLWLQDVPDFEWVYIHVGNDDDDTEGCILPGMQRGPNMTVLQSARAYGEIYKACWKAADEGRLSILITNPR